jgi:hypothetical protein
MKKIFTLAAALMMLSASAETLTVFNEGDSWNYYVPINSLWFDEADIRNQVLYPADALTEMVDKDITSITFYTDEYGCYMNGGLLTISMGETDVNALSTYIEGLTVVGTATMVKHTGEPVEVTITFSTPYHYNGGNLVFDNYITQPGDYGMTYFKGVATNYCTSLAFSYGSITQRNFLPMTTFGYEAGDAPVVPTQKTDAPSSAKENYVYNDGNLYYNAYTITLSETEPSTIYYRIGLMDTDGQYVYGEWMEYVDVLNFNVEGSYMLEAYAIAEGKTESDHIFDGFTVSKMTDVEELAASKTVACVRYYNLAGQEMQQANGLTIVVTTYTDGTTSTVKVMK